jgi:GNAT superfamily N-acetyltransferase
MMPVPAWREEAIAKVHDRKNFDCGQADLNNFLAQYARQAHESGASKTYCAVEIADAKTIRGFYTISPGQVEMQKVPMAFRPGAGGRYPFSGFRLARLAVSSSCQGQKLGGHLLARAISRCMRVSRDVGGTALLIDAKDEKAAAWYGLYGAVALVDHPLALVITYAEFNRARVAAGLPPL